jgi:hypothetical protein
VAVVLPMAETLLDTVSTTLKEKKKQFNNIEDDRSGMPPIVVSARKCCMAIFGELHNIYPDNYQKIVDLFQIDEMYKDERDPDFLYKNQALVRNPVKSVINLPSPKFAYSYEAVIDNRGPNGMWIYLSYKIGDARPALAIYVPGNTKIKEFIENMGVVKQKNLMLEFEGDLSLVDVKITLRKRRK